MSIQSHTPGPWQTIVRHNPYQADWIIDCDIGLIKPPLSMPRAEIEANARLIAAAPDLLAALQAIVNGSIRISNKANDMLSEHDPKVIAARAAIAKAQGA